MPLNKFKGRDLQETRMEREWVKWYNCLLTVTPCLVDISGGQLLSEEKKKEQWIWENGKAGMEKSVEKGGCSWEILYERRISKNKIKTK